MTLTERTPAIPHPDALPPPRLDVKDALSICFAMVDEDPSLHRAATTMWNTLARFVPALTPAQEELAVEALDALGGPDAPTQLRTLRRRASQPDLADLAFVLDRWLAQLAS